MALSDPPTDAPSRATSWLTIGKEMLTPSVVLQILKDGNDRFVRGEPAGHDVHEALRITAEGQSPFAAVVSCIDNRVLVDTVFDLPRLLGARRLQRRRERRGARGRNPTTARPVPGRP